MIYLFLEPPVEEVFEGPVQCYRCGEMFEELALVKKHLTTKHLQCRKIHYGKQREFQCDLCKGMFATDEKKNNHYCRYSLSENEKWGKNHCDICDITFTNRDKLLSHNTTYHLIERKFACDQCDFKV